MSSKSVSTFFEKVAKDKALSEELAVVIQKSMRTAVARVAAKKGFKFTSKELVDHVTEELKKLNDAELEALVHGGSISRLPDFTLLSLLVSKEPIDELWGRIRQNITIRMTPTPQPA